MSGSEMETLNTLQNTVKGATEEHPSVKIASSKAGKGIPEDNQLQLSKSKINLMLGNGQSVNIEV